MSWTVNSKLKPNFPNGLSDHEGEVKTTFRKVGNSLPIDTV